MDADQSSGFRDGDVLLVQNRAHGTSASGLLLKVPTGAVAGMDGALVEVDIAQSGLPNFLIVGSPDALVSEDAQRPSTMSIPASTSWS